jgi:protein-tyrosine phosphatase
LIDVHCHALPGAGERPGDDREAVALLTALAADGVEVVAVTPSVGGELGAEVVERVRDDVGRLRAAARGETVPALVPGAELDLGWALAASDEDLAKASYGQLGKTLLVGTPAHSTLPDFDDMVLNLKLRGYGVLLAHPEIGTSYQQEPERLSRLIREGVLLQIDAESIVDETRSRSRRLARALLGEGSAHVIASGGRPGRPPRLGDAVEEAERLIGTRARWMVVDVPAAVLAGAPLPAAPALAGGPKGLFRRARAR